MSRADVTPALPGLVRAVQRDPPFLVGVTCDSEAMASPDVVVAAEEGCYEAARAAALSGVPISTVYDWARNGVVVPSISPSQEKLWSYADLVALRLAHWLRHPKWPHGSRRVPASPMVQVRDALAALAGHAAAPWTADGLAATIRVDAAGEIFVDDGGGFVDLARQPLLELDDRSLDLLRPFSLDGGPGGPDLVRPRPAVRIVPAKVAGEPHLVGTRITTRTVAALTRRGLPAATVGAWFSVAEQVVAEADDLERQLAHPAAA